MTNPINLKEIERKAFRSTYQDGLWDIYYGLLVICMALFIRRPADGYSAWNVIMMVLSFSICYGLFWAGKKYITIPRMGQVKFGAIRKKKTLTMGIILGVFVLIHVGLVALTMFSWVNLEASIKLSSLFGSLGSEGLVVALIGSLILGTSMIVIAYFSDFTRGFYIAVLMALAVFLMIYINQPIYAILIGILIILPGVVHLIRFLKAYPLHKEKQPNA